MIATIKSFGEILVQRVDKVTFVAIEEHYYTILEQNDENYANAYGNNKTIV